MIISVEICVPDLFLVAYGGRTFRFLVWKSPIVFGLIQLTFDFVFFSKISLFSLKDFFKNCGFGLGRYG